MATSPHPILLIGGSGVVGRWTARLLRDAHPDTPLLIGGRNVAKAEEAAALLGHGEAARVPVDAGARLDLTTHAGLTPRGLALLYGYDDLARCLAEADRASSDP